MKHLLVLRISAFGDVALAIPVVREFLQQHPDVRITFVSSPAFADIFKGIDRLEFFPVYVHGRHKGPLGMVRLVSDLLKKDRYDAVLDLHSVIRTHMMRFLFHMRFVPVYKMYKIREERKRLTRKDNKIKSPIKPIPECYADVFRRAGYTVTLSNKLSPHPREVKPSTLEKVGGRRDSVWIGIAPFSQYTGKSYPLDRMFEAVKNIARFKNADIFLFGAPGAEAETLKNWSQSLDNVHTGAGSVSLGEELDIISNLRVMVSMDSANMHLASLMGVRVISVWGATHHFAGFLGYGQSADDIIGAEMDCRPCSVFGNKECWKGTYECMTAIQPELIACKVEEAAGLV